MGRISQYPLDTDIQGNDKWIGTSVVNANATKNFSVDTVAEYLNKSGSVDSQTLRYTYQNVQGDDVRLASTISFSPSLGDNVPFDEITEWIISAYSKQIKDVRTFYEAPLVGKTILITNAFNPSNWAIYRWDSVVEDIDDPNFYVIGLTHIESTGELVANQDYLIALLDAASGGTVSWGSIIGTLSSQTDLQNALNAKQAALVSGTNIQSINGSTILTSGDLALQVPLVSGTNIKTINSTTLLGSGDIAVQPTLVSGTNIKTINGTTLLGSGDIAISSSVAWGGITGTLSSQTDLQTALNGKQASLVSGTNIKTVNSVTLLGSGDIAVQSTLVSGTNIKTINSTTILGSGDIAVQETLVSGTNIKTINGTSILGSGNIVISGGSATWGSITGTLSSQTDLQSALNSKQDTLISATNIKTINGSSILGSGNLAIAAGASGVVGSVQFSDGTALSSDATNFFWDDTNNRLGIGINTPSHPLHIKGTGTTSATASFYAQNSTADNYVRFRDDGRLQVFDSTSGLTSYLSGIDCFSYRVGTVGVAGYGWINFNGEFALRDGVSNNLYIDTNTSRFVKGLGINTSGPNDASVALQVDSTTKGFAPPRMTTAQRDAIVSPIDGLILYNTTSKTFQYRINGVWEEFGMQSAAITSATAAINTTETIIVQSPVMTANRFMASTIVKIIFNGTCTSTAANASTFRVRIGTTGTIADGIVLSVGTGGSATSGTNNPFSGEINLVIRTTGASATAFGYLTLYNQGTTGISTTSTRVIQGTMTNFNSTTANFVSVTYESAGATTTSTFQYATIEIID